MVSNSNRGLVLCEKTLIIIALSMLLGLMYACAGNDGPYDDIKHFGKENIICTSLVCDTLRLDAQYTSLSGQWHMKDDIICFVDEYAVGVKEYDHKGHFIGEHIRQGKGPDEVLAASFISTFDKSTGDFIMQDSNCFMHRFSKDYKKQFSLNRAWFTALSPNYGDLGNKAWYDLYNHPDPEVPEMYEYNFECNRMQAIDSVVIIPTITEHINYNGYGNRNSKRFWTDSYIFIRFRPEAVESSKVIFGHYPPVYHKRNIPVFSNYDFYAEKDGLAVTFAADPRIFLMDYDGNVTGSFGFSEKGISGQFPETTSFEEYDSKYKKMRKEHGYYDRLVKCGDFIFRTCRLDKAAGTILQIYYGDYNLVGRVPVSDGFEMIGEYDSTYYAYDSLDLDSEQFIFLSFSI